MCLCYPVNDLVVMNNRSLLSLGLSETCTEQIFNHAWLIGVIPSATGEMNHIKDDSALSG